MVNTIRQIYDTFCIGDPMSDEDLKVAIPYFKSLADKLGNCGPVFRLAYTEANRVYLTMDDFRRSRSCRTASPDPAQPGVG